MTTTPLAATLASAVLVLAGCGSDAETEASPAEPTPSASAGAVEPTEAPEPTTGPEGVQVDVEVADGSVTPQGERVEVTAGEPVTISVRSDVADEIHVHGDPEVTIEVEAGGTAEETFTLDVPGQAAVESHALGVTIVQLVVRP